MVVEVKQKRVSTGAGSRSPSYPPFSVATAIERVGQIWRATRNNAVSDLIIAQNMGYQSMNGTSRTNIAGMKKYGLLETYGKDKLRLSDAAKALAMLTPDNPEFIEAVWEAAMRPAIFSELYESYGYDLPDDRNLQYYLVGKKFSPDVARDVVKNYRQTLDYLEQIGGPPPAYQTPETTQTITAEATAPFVTNGANHSPAPVSNTVYNASAELHVSLSDDCKVHLMFEGRVTQKVLRKLTSYLRVFAEDYEDDLPTAPARSQKMTAQYDDENEILALPLPEEDEEYDS